jgi:hypothetical protein
MKISRNIRIYICGFALFLNGGLNLVLGERHECAFKIGNIFLCQDEAFRFVGALLLISAIGIFLRIEVARKAAAIFCIVNMAQLVIKFAATELAITSIVIATSVILAIYAPIVNCLSRPAVMDHSGR